MKKENDKVSSNINEIFEDDILHTINNTDNQIEGLKQNIDQQKLKQSTISKYIDELNILISSSTDDEISKDLLSTGIIISESIKENINSLYNLKRNLTEINQSIGELLKSIDSTQKEKTFYNTIIESITNRVENYQKNYEEILNTIKENDLIYTTFLKKDINKNYTKMIDFNTMILKEFTISEIKKNTNQFIKEVNIPDNKTLIISEDYVYLPYKCSEINNYLRNYPNEFDSADDVIKKEFIYDRSFFSKCAPISRFRETYSLIHDREGKSMFEALKLAFELMFRYDLQPAIIAACKLQDELEEYIDCLNNNDLKNFSKFEIKYQINPF